MTRQARKPMWRQVLIAVLGVVALLWAALTVVGAIGWQRGTGDRRARLEATRVPGQPRRVDFAELAGLPFPVARYFRAVLRDGQPFVAAADLVHEGTFNLGAIDDRWRPFTSTQRVVTGPPGFDWDGQIAMLPGVPVRVHDTYMAREGILRAALFGLIPLAEARGTAALAEGELLRYLAEAVWVPTALLPSQGVRWEAIDASAARATLRDGAITATLRFEFDAHGLIESVRADARGRAVGDAMVPTPWRGRFWAYADRGGMRVPLDGEVAWLLPTGLKPYWRGHLRAVTHEFAPAE